MAACSQRFFSFVFVLPFRPTGETAEQKQLIGKYHAAAG
jgi:hypothetical protein